LAKLDAKAKEEEVQLWQSTTAAVLSFIDEVCQANVKTLRDHHLKQRGRSAPTEEDWRPGLQMGATDDLSSPLPPGISPAMAAMYSRFENPSMSAAMSSIETVIEPIEPPQRIPTAWSRRSKSPQGSEAVRARDGAFGVVRKHHASAAAAFTPCGVCRCRPRGGGGDVSGAHVRRWSGGCSHGICTGGVQAAADGHRASDSLHSARVPPHIRHVPLVQRLQRRRPGGSSSSSTSSCAVAAVTFCGGSISIAACIASSCRTCRLRCRAEYHPVGLSSVRP